ncbi:MAG: hypothetical protein ACK4NA_03315 [Alphaproteobacteria bacterium]
MTDADHPPVNPDALEGPHGLVCQAYLEGTVHLGLKYFELNKRGSPVFKLWENVLPYAMMAAIVAQYTYDYGYLGFMGSLLLTGLLVFWFAPRWLAKRVRARALAMALESEAGWDRLWQSGGLGMRLAKGDNISADSPGDDWRAFAEKYLKE